MSIDVQETVSEGFDRATARNGLILAAVYFVVQLINIAVSNTQAQNAMEQMGGQMPGGFGPLGGAAGPEAVQGITLPLPSPVLALLSLALALVGVLLTLVAARLFVSDETETVPEEYYQRNLVGGFINLLIGSIVMAILVGIGLILLIVPGIFLLVSFAFMIFVVSVEDESFVEGLSRSWDLAQGNRLDIFLVMLVIFVIGFVLNLVAGAALFALPATIADVVTAAVSGFMSVFGIASIAQIYRTLTAEGEATS